METRTLLLLIVFNALIWWIVVARLIALARNVTRKVAVVFAVGMLFQAIHSVILPFGDWFGQFFSGRIVNFLEIGCAIVSAFLLYYTVYLFWEYSLSVEENEAIYERKPPSLFSEPVSALCWGMFLSLLAVLTLEVFIAGQTGDLLTPSSTSIGDNIYLLTGRFVSMGYIVVAEMATAFVFLAILKSTYGKQHATRLYAATISILTHASHFAVNLITTFILFFVDPATRLAETIQATYLKFDTFILIPLGLSFFIAVGPGWLIDRLNEMFLISQLLLYHQGIYQLRNMLVELFPVVKLPISTYGSYRGNYFKRIRYETTRYVIECSDALHLLAQGSNSTSSTRKDPSLRKLSNIDFSADAKLIAQSILLFREKKPIPSDLTKQLESICVFRAETLNDLYWLYAKLAKKLINALPY